MKTKIIYISGNEVFEIAQIRAAFEEVRSALGLDNDTILFGVPVDADNALANTTSESTTAQEPTPITTTEIEVCEEIIEPAPEITPIISEVIEQNIPTEPMVEIIPEPLQEIESVADTVEETAVPETEPETEPVIPILSILSTNDDAPEQTVEASEPCIETVAEATTIEQPEIDNAETLTVSIDDIVADEAPVIEREKTLEELLESMEPLGEDEIPELDIAPEGTTEDTDFSISMTDNVADTDATLAQLASEFAQTQDKIPDAPKSSSNGKIGKLKNILPFKKAKRDDSGLMGDLFGWAGIAANDEDFSIPGFFTSAGGQK